MHSNKVSVIIALIIITIGVFLLIVYYEKQGEYTFSFIKSLYNEIRRDQISTVEHAAGLFSSGRKIMNKLAACSTKK